MNLPPAPAAPQIDWNQVQSRMERLGVVGYAKNRLPSGAIHVAMTIAGQSTPIEAQGPTEAAAVLAILEQAERQPR